METAKESLMANPTATQPQPQPQPERNNAMETAMETAIKKTEITPFHFTLTRDGVRLDVVWKQFLAEKGLPAWRISEDGKRLDTLCNRQAAETKARELVAKASETASETASVTASEPAIEWVAQPIAGLPHTDLATKPIRVANGNALVAKVIMLPSGRFDYGISDNVNGYCSKAKKESYAKQETAIRKAENALTLELETQGICNPNATETPSEGVTATPTATQPVTASEPAIEWVAQPIAGLPHTDLATKPIRVANGNALVAEVIMLPSGRFDYGISDNVNGYCSKAKKESYAKQETAIRKAENALTLELETQGIYNPNATETPSEGVTATPTATQPETASEPATVTIPLKTAQRVQALLKSYIENQGQPATAYSSYNDLAKAIKKTETETAPAVETVPIADFVFGKVKPFGNGPNKSKRVGVYSQGSGSMIGYIYKVGARKWQTDSNITVSLGLTYALEDVYLPSLKKRLRARVGK